MSAVLSRPLQLVPMREADLEEVVAAERTLYDYPWTLTNFRDSLTAGYSAWVVRQEGHLVAYAVVMIVLDEAHLLNISVVRASQKRGYGAALLRRLRDMARENGAIRMYLEVRPSNRAALALYRRNGFTDIGVRRGYYPALFGREDAIVMGVDF